jgi:hypothetical protein
MLSIPVVEVSLCTTTAYLVARGLSRGERWPWLPAGSTLGLAILAKHSSLLWGGALAIGMLGSPARRVLANRWPWFGAAIALGFFAPNLVWQANNGFATVEFMRTLRQEAYRWLVCGPWETPEGVEAYRSSTYQVDYVEHVFRQGECPQVVLVLCSDQQRRMTSDDSRASLPGYP